MSRRGSIIMTSTPDLPNDILLLVLVTVEGFHASMPGFSRRSVFPEPRRQSITFARPVVVVAVKLGSNFVFGVWRAAARLGPCVVCNSHVRLFVCLYCGAVHLKTRTVILQTQRLQRGRETLCLIEEAGEEEPMQGLFDFSSSVSSRSWPSGGDRAMRHSLERRIRRRGTPL